MMKCLTNNKMLNMCIHTSVVEENQLTFTCHLKRCPDGDDQQTAYELVQVRGNFRRWNSDTSKEKLLVYLFYRVN